MRLVADFGFLAWAPHRAIAKNFITTNLPVQSWRSKTWTRRRMVPGGHRFINVLARLAGITICMVNQLSLPAANWQTREQQNGEEVFILVEHLILYSNCSHLLFIISVVGKRYRRFQSCVKSWTNQKLGSLGPSVISVVRSVYRATLSYS